MDMEISFMPTIIISLIMDIDLIFLLSDTALVFHLHEWMLLSLILSDRCNFYRSVCVIRDIR